MALMDESVWRGTFCPPTGTPFGGTNTSGTNTSGTGISGTGISGTGARFGGTANLEAFTGTRWVTIRGDIAPNPF